MSVPVNRDVDTASLITSALADAMVIGTSDYYPARDCSVKAFENGQPETVRLSELFGRPIA